MNNWLPPENKLFDEIKSPFNLNPLNQFTMKYILFISAFVIITLSSFNHKINNEGVSPPNDSIIKMLEIPDGINFELISEEEYNLIPENEISLIKDADNVTAENNSVVIQTKNEVISYKSINGEGKIYRGKNKYGYHVIETNYGDEYFLTIVNEKTGDELNVSTTIFSPNEKKVLEIYTYWALTGGTPSIYVCDSHKKNLEKIFELSVEKWNPYEGKWIDNKTFAVKIQFFDSEYETTGDYYYLKFQI